MGAYSGYADQDLVRLLFHNDHDAFVQLYERHWFELYRSAYYILRDKDAAKDIVQDIFVWIWENRISSAHQHIITSPRPLHFICISAYPHIRTSIIYPANLLTVLLHNRIPPQTHLRRQFPTLYTPVMRQQLKLLYLVHLVELPVVMIHYPLIMM